ncbi:hypothetical protein NM962_01255 [Mycobacterium sp. SVM_VP21]|nr:hypothetical protein NM962_01255 [Mycobacterium sp. SVM_VP21]
MNIFQPGTSPRKLNSNQAIEFVRALVTAINRSKNVPLQGELSIADNGALIITLQPTGG